MGIVEHDVDLDATRPGGRRVYAFALAPEEQSLDRGGMFH